METSWESTNEENTYVLDSEGAAEMARLTEQHRVVTRYMGGLLHKSIKIPAASTILDVACGPGGWVLDTAFEYPKSEIVGIDISNNLIQYAHAQARAQGLQQAARFQMMDATKQFDFADASFDLVNARFLIGFLAPTAWPTFIQECMRITRPEGYIQLTECDDMGTTNSPAFEHLWTLCARAFQTVGAIVTSHKSAPTASPEKQGILEDDGENGSDGVVLGGTDVFLAAPDAMKQESHGASELGGRPCPPLAGATILDTRRNGHNGEGRYSSFSAR